LDRELAARACPSNLRGSEARPVASNRGADADAVRRIAAADCEAPLASRHELADVGDDAGEHGARLSPRPAPRTGAKLLHRLAGTIGSRSPWSCAFWQTRLPLARSREGGRASLRSLARAGPMWTRSSERLPPPPW